MPYHKDTFMSFQYTLILHEKVANFISLFINASTAHVTMATFRLPNSLSKRGLLQRKIAGMLANDQPWPICPHVPHVSLINVWRYNSANQPFHDCFTHLLHGRFEFKPSTRSDLIPQ